MSSDERTPEQPAVSVVVPAGPGAEHLAACLRALARCRPEPSETIVVVDGAGDGTVAMAREAGAAVIELSRPVGPAAARNRGARRARSDVLLFIDSDVEVRSDLVGRVAMMLAGDGQPAAVFGSYDDDPAAPGLVSQYRNLLHHWVHQHARGQASTFWSGCGAVCRAAFEAAGGFPEAYVEPSIEDIALGDRLRRVGCRITLDPTMQVRHLKRWSFWSMMHTDLTRRAIPWSELMVRQRRLINDLNVDSVSRVSVGLVGLLVASGVAAIAWPPAAVAGLAAALLLVTVNFPFYRFLARRRGLWFATRAVPLHWLYYLVCGVGFAVGALRAIVLKDAAPRSAGNRAEAA